MPPRGGRKCNRQGRCRTSRRRDSAEVRNPTSLAVSRASARNTMAPRSWPTGLAARIGTGDLHALDCRDHPWLRAHGGGTYVADTMATAGAKPVMVNWDVVAKNLDSVTTLARAGWKKIAGRAD